MVTTNSPVLCPPILTNLFLRGLQSPPKFQVPIEMSAKIWAGSLDTELSFLCLQELKDEAFKMNYHLKFFLPDYSVVTAHSIDGKGGDFVLIHKSTRL